MDPDADLAAVASLMADRHRAQMLLTLLGGTPQSGSALAEAAGISRSLASAHLKKLVAGELVRAQPSGRQQLYSVASAADVSRLERRTRPLVRACLDWSERRYHLAGSLGAG
jgi:DNA-binding transcriptional ArsR family regulator